MDLRQLSIPDAFVVTPTVHGDDRGALWEWFRSDRFVDATGHPFTMVQANASVSSRGALRGIHFAQVPPGQAKWVTCLRGSIVDVVVDLRVGSPAYSQWEATTLDDVSRKAVYLSEGLGHAFLSLEDNTVVSYICSAPYTPDREHVVHPLDPALGIEWPTVAGDGSPLTPLLSPRDEAAPSLDEVRAKGLLPSYDETRAYVESLRG